MGLIKMEFLMLIFVFLTKKADTSLRGMEIQWQSIYYMHIFSSTPHCLALSQPDVPVISPNCGRLFEFIGPSATYCLHTFFEKGRL